MNKLASALTGTEGERVALCDVSVSALLQDLLAEVTVSQTYRNDERVNIEAVYTFPLPLDAVLLDLEVEIGGRQLKGVVVEKKAAEEKYEDAVAAGDAAVMLENDRAWPVHDERRQSAASGDGEDHVQLRDPLPLGR
jgi:Ca-activated chloride channel family protein